jgi:hypothetical protein
MIFYRPTDGDVYNAKMPWRARTCFVMSAMGDLLPSEVVSVRRRLRTKLRQTRFKQVDAASVTTGQDYLLKIWLLAATCPVGIAIVHEGIRPETMANIYYELGLMQAFGRETLVIKVGDVKLPSDLARTEYLSFDRHFRIGLQQFFRALQLRADFYENVGRAVSKNPLLAIDYFGRAYLLTGKRKLRSEVATVFSSMRLHNRSAHSVERLMAAF